MSGMGDTNINNWRPFIYGGLASIVAELGKFVSIIFFLANKIAKDINRL